MQPRPLALSLTSFLLVISSVFCGLVTPATPTPAPPLSTSDFGATMVAVQATQTALVAPPTHAAQPTTAQPATGSIAGSLSYPSEFIPPLRVIAFHLDTGNYYALDTAKDQRDYQIDHLPPGNYHVVAYEPALGLGGGYSQAVPCGLSVDCTDHSLIIVVVQPGQVTSGVDPGDWYAPEGAFPPMPAP